MVSDVNSAANSNIKMTQDFVLPFQIDEAHINGRFIRCQTSLSKILNRHDYPTPVARLLGEALLVIALIGSGMKLQHRILLQIKGDGALPLLVADYYADGSMRGYVECNQELYDKWTGGEEINPFLLLGKGHLAITIDNGNNTKPYQGIVSLEGESLSRSVLNYIEVSDQIMSSLKLVLNQKDFDGSKQWYGSAMLIQKLGKAGEDFKTSQPTQEDAEEWGKNKALFATLSDEELADDELAPDRLLFRLFHEAGVRVFDKIPLKFECQCDMEKLEVILKNSNREDLKEMADEKGIIEANCQFCRNTYQFFLEKL